MDAQFDKPFESWGGFSTTESGKPMIHGHLQYHPDKRIELDLVENQQGAAFGHQGVGTSIKIIYGQLVDGTLVTLFDCFVSGTSIGAGIGSPTKITVRRVIFAGHIDDLNQLKLKKYTITLSSLSNWTCAGPVDCQVTQVDGKVAGFDVTCRIPTPIEVTLPDREFDLQITHGMQTKQSAGSFVVEWKAGFTIRAHDSLPFEKMHEIAWQCLNLLSLLIGHRTSMREITMVPADAGNTDAPLRLVYNQIEKHDHPDAHSALMLLPYTLVKDDFAQMVDRWFARSDQEVLATNVFFSSHSLQSPAVNVKFLATTQAAESYHRSLGTGLYMDSDAYDAAIQEFITHIPPAIQGDHRVSLKNRLKYGNEYSLRKRLDELFNRLPKNVCISIATDVAKFIVKVVDTRNYYTHYDHASEGNAFEPKVSYIAAERLRILVVANLLHDLGIKDDNLLEVLRRSEDFVHWMSQQLPL